MEERKGLNTDSRNGLENKIHNNAKIITFDSNFIPDIKTNIKKMKAKIKPKI